VKGIREMKMKLAIWGKMNLQMFLLSVLLFSSSLSFANDPDLTITPVFNQFQHVVLGTNSTPTTFIVRNTHNSITLNISTVSLQGTHAAEFAVGTDNCAGQTILAGGSCSIDVIYQPTTFGSKMAMLQVGTDATNTPTLTAFLSNHEGDAKQAERRLPPVLFSLGIVETMADTGNYSLDWSILGYHDSYESVVALFDCTGKAPGDCGVNFTDNFFNSGLITSSSTTPQPTWTFNGEAAVQHHFSQSFSPNTDGFPQVASDTYEIVVRFYRKNNMDVMSGEPSLSLMAPGNLTNEYYDDEGRRITKYINIP
jgi:hypothetical protein